MAIGDWSVPPGGWGRFSLHQSPFNNSLASPPTNDSIAKRPTGSISLCKLPHLDRPHPWRRREFEVAVGHRYVLLLTAEAELSNCPVYLMENDAGNLAVIRDLQKHLRDAVFHALGDTAQNYIARLGRDYIRGKRKGLEFLGQLCLAQQIAQR